MKRHRRPMRANLKPPGSCAFCGAAGNLTKEHVLPSWLSSVFPGGPADSHVDAQIRWQSGAHGVNAKRKPGRSLTRKVRAVYANCNSGWLSRLEHQVKPCLQALVRGQPLVLDQEVQRLLAAWIAKTSMVADRVRPELAAMPIEHRQFLMNRHEPPNGWSVWMARNSGRAWKHAVYHGTGAMHPAVLDPASGTLARNVQSTSFGIGSLLLIASAHRWNRCFWK